MGWVGMRSKHRGLGIPPRRQDIESLGADITRRNLCPSMPTSLCCRLFLKMVCSLARSSMEAALTVLTWLVDEFVTKHMLSQTYMLDLFTYTCGFVYMLSALESTSMCLTITCVNKQHVVTHVKQTNANTLTHEPQYIFSCVSATHLHP